MGVKRPEHVFDTIRPVTPEDYPEISAWLRHRDLKGLKPELTPPQGFIAPGVACGFMITTNTGVGILEHFVSSLEAPRAAREQALERIAELLIHAGQISGMKMFLALTSSNKVKELCILNGFNPIPGMEVWIRGS